MNNMQYEYNIKTLGCRVKEIKLYFKPNAKFKDNIYSNELNQNKYKLKTTTNWPRLTPAAHIR
jgi:hypothetical protein